MSKFLKKDVEQLSKFDENYTVIQNVNDLSNFLYYFQNFALYMGVMMVVTKLKREITQIMI